MNDVKIYELDHQGRGIGKINNKIIFVKNALPNEIVRVKIIKKYLKHLLKYCLEKFNRLFMDH